jgi:hypothetical protein
MGGESTSPDLRWIHRSLPGSDIYFVANGGDVSQQVNVSFRVTGRLPQLWHADTGETSPATYQMEKGSTQVRLSLERGESVFVVFRKPTTQIAQTVAEPAWIPVPVRIGSWEVQFDAGRGAPLKIMLDELASWTVHADPGVKYYSGTATYSTAVDVPRDALAGATAVRLDLGDVKDLAEVAVNGRPLGILWKPPFAVDVTSALKAGSNQITVKVTNVWPNRIIGDKQPGATRIAYSSFDPYRADSPLLPSGLLGPVRFELQRQAH